MEKTDVVKSVQSNGTFEFNGKTFYKYEVQMENGDVGDYNSISQDQNNFIAGKVVNYLYDVSKPKYPKIKPIYNFTGSPKNNGDYQNKQKAQRGDDVQKMIVRQSCLKAAVELSSKNAKLEDILAAADVFVDWVYDVESKEEKYLEVKSKKETTDLPF